MLGLTTLMVQEAIAAHTRRQIIKNFDPGILWDEYGIRHDIVVRLCGILVYVNDIYFICSSTIYTWISSC